MPVPGLSTKEDYKQMFPPDEIAYIGAVIVLREPSQNKLMAIIGFAKWVWLRTSSRMWTVKSTKYDNEVGL